MSFATFVGFNIASKKVALPPHERFTDSVGVELSLENVSVYQVERNRLHLCYFGEILKFDYVFKPWRASLA